MSRKCYGSGPWKEMNGLNKNQNSKDKTAKTKYQRPKAKEPKNNDQKKCRGKGKKAGRAKG